MRSESELFVLYLVAGKDWITTQEVKDSLNAALNSRDKSKHLRFGLGHETISEMLMGFLAHGWLEVRMPPGKPEQGEWKVNEVGRQVLARAPHDLQARLGIQPAAV